MRLFFKVIMKFLREADMFLLLLCLASSIYGLILISSVERTSEANYVSVQVGALVIGIVLFIIFSYIDIDIIADKTKILFFASLFFISTLFIWGVGSEEVGESGWLRFWNIGIQPAEVVKIPFAIIIAKMIADYKDRRSLNMFISLLKLLIVSGMIIALILRASEDLGSSLIYMFMLVMMLFIGGVKLRWFILSGGILAALSPLLFNYFLTPRQQDRILAPFLQEVIDPTRQYVLWQPDLSVRAISSGEFLGQGLGSGRITQAGLIPEQRTDFIFSAAGEELGFVGCLLIIFLLVVIIARCIQIGVKSNNSLGLLVCSGFAAMLISQMLANIGMCLGIMPVIGITLPYFSYGGSSLVTCFATAGIVSGIKMRPKPLRFRSYF